MDGYVFVSGMVAPVSDPLLPKNQEIVNQVNWLMKAISAQLTKNDSSLADVIYLRIFLLDINLSNEVNRTIAAHFENDKPACSYFQVTALPSPTALVEIETYAGLSTNTAEKVTN